MTSVVNMSSTEFGEVPAVPASATNSPGSLPLVERAALSSIIGQSDGMRHVLALVARAGSSRGGVLITGEAGTGRSLVARAIHECGGANHRPFVFVNCEKSTPGEVDAALFGVPDAAGSPSPPSGRFERLYPGSAVHAASEGGTLYLTHVEELPDRAQARLARVLRDGEARVGDRARFHSVDIRLIAAVEPDFETCVREGRVRHDLHRRLAGTSIVVPPLRERRADIPALARHFLQRASHQAGVSSRTLHEAAMSVLAALPWWGNAKELKALVETLVLKSAGDEIDLEAVLDHVRLDDASGRVPALASGETLREARARFERDYIAATLAQHRGRIPEAARALGIQRTNLYRKLRSLHLSREANEKTRRGR